ncbi:helix-turn-helix domain-containing protein [Lentzea cavernae]|uniref:Transcriptional regulator n=1 Tax=Lentzea cavernae TaxID=2020703 RepID=A0ABQ3M2K9_9PSEU|nr:helix-turn-helix transcriptional regulator [Lentzea cavernae]GHH32092.1 transcriptional regulator [Lentzea cavernae]
MRAAIKVSGMPARRVAELVGWQEAKLSDFLNGKIGCTETELALLLGVCRTPVEERDHLLSLRPAMHVKGWWQKHGSHPPVRLRTLVENVEAAKTLTTWHPHGLPVYLQSADYTRAAIAACPNMPDEETDLSLNAGRELQELLSCMGLQCTFYIHEQALHLPVGGQEAHVGQVHHLLLTTVRTNVTIRILPTAVGAHAGLSGPFTRLTFPAHEPLVFVELENSTLVEEDKDSVEGYLQVVRALDRFSLNAEQSKVMLLQLAERLSKADSSGHDRSLPRALAVGLSDCGR